MHESALSPPLDERRIRVALASTPRLPRLRMAQAVLSPPAVVRVVRAVLRVVKRATMGVVSFVHWQLVLAVSGPRPPPGRLV